MRKLLHAGFARLTKSRAFWLTLFGTAALSIWVVFANYKPQLQASSDPLCWDDVFFIAYQIFGIFLAACISLFVGTEHADGTLRNKLVVGHTRGRIYVSTLVLSLFVCAAVLALHGALTFAVGRPLFGGTRADTTMLLVRIGCAALAMLAQTALFVAIALNCSSRSVTAVSTLLLTLALMFAASFVGGALEESELTYESIVITENGIEFGEQIPNPAYVTGTLRAVYRVLYDLLPFGQLMQVESGNAAQAARWAVYSAALLLAVTVCGYAAFRRKDLK